MIVCGCTSRIILHHNSTVKCNGEQKWEKSTLVARQRVKIIVMHFAHFKCDKTSERRQSSSASTSAYLFPFSLISCSFVCGEHHLTLLKIARTRNCNDFVDSVAYASLQFCSIFPFPRRKLQLRRDEKRLTSDENAQTIKQSTRFLNFTQITRNSIDFLDTRGVAMMFDYAKIFKHTKRRWKSAIFCLIFTVLKPPKKIWKRLNDLKNRTRLNRTAQTNGNELVSVGIEEKRENNWISKIVIVIASVLRIVAHQQNGSLWWTRRK